MPKIKEQTFPDGSTHRVEEMDFEVIKEDWNEYQLIDGTTVRMRSNMHKVYWVVDDNDNRMFTREGDPFLIVRSGNQIVASEQ